MQFQAELRQPIPKVIQKSLRLRPALEAGDQIVSIPDDNYIALCHFLSPRFDPQVKDIVQIDIRQQRRNHRALRSTYPHLRPLALLRNTRRQPFANQADDTGIAHAVLDKFHDPFLAHLVKEPSDVRIEYPVHSPPVEPNTERIQRLVRVSTGPEPIRKATKIRLIYFIEDGRHCLLNNFVLQGGDSQRALPPVCFRYVDPSRRLSPVRSTMYAAVQIGEPILQSRLILLPCNSVHPGSGFPLQSVKAVPQQIDRHMMKQGREPFLLSSLCYLTHTAQSL